jgi:hypothetical protein
MINSINDTCKDKTDYYECVTTRITYIGCTDKI